MVFSNIQICFYVKFRKTLIIITWSISEIDLFRKQFFCLLPSFCHTQPVRACQRLDLVSKVLDKCLDFVLGDEPGAGFAPPGPPRLRRRRRCTGGSGWFHRRRQNELFLAAIKTTLLAEDCVEVGAQLGGILTPRAGTIKIPEHRGKIISGQKLYYLLKGLLFVNFSKFNHMLLLSEF